MKENEETEKMKLGIDYENKYIIDSVKSVKDGNVIIVKYIAGKDGKPIDRQILEYIRYIRDTIEKELEIKVGVIAVPEGMYLSMKELDELMEHLIKLKEEMKNQNANQIRIDFKS